MALPASERRLSAPGRLAALLQPFPGRLEFAARLALISVRVRHLTVPFPRRSGIPRGGCAASRRRLVKHNFLCPGQMILVLVSHWFFLPRSQW